jgi:acyl-CoA synthetase (NDP forming)
VPGTAVTTLLEPDAFQLLEGAGIRCPRRLFARNADEAATLDVALLGSPRVAVKVVSAEIAHKTDVGGVAIVDSTSESVTAAIRVMERRLADHPIAGFSIAEFIPYDPSPGGEWLVGLRWTDEFGPVVSIGAGGVATEFLAKGIEPGRDVAVFSPGRTDPARIDAALERLLFTPLAIGNVRNQPARTTLARLRGTVERFATLARSCRPDGLRELEVNPLVVACSGELVALDVLAVVGSRPLHVPPPRPAEKLRHLLTPRTIAVAGVSTSLNPGHVILNNLIRGGFAREAITVVKPAVAEIEGCKAVPSIAALRERVDLLVLSIPAAQVPEALIDTVEHRKAESAIVIPGGLEEKAGTAALVAQMHAVLEAARETDWGGPVVNGGNCLGIQSLPGHYDTMFLPPHKLDSGSGTRDPGSGTGDPGSGIRDQGFTLAIVAQSGAFAASRMTRLAGIRPRYCITVGNQMDLTIGDYLAFLERDPVVKVFGVYVEGFKPLDGAATLDAIRRITAGGSTVILYRAGRTAAGAQATASHTASVAGDYTVTRELARAAGAIVADTLDDFTDLVVLFSLLQSCPVYGRRLGAISNAGYECVAIADNLGELELSPLTDATRARLSALFEASRLSTVVDVHNPLDLTPITDDAGYEAAVRRVLEDDSVDVAVVGCVPATPALNTLPASPDHREDLLREGSVAQRLVQVRRESHKPWIAIVDAGPLYDPLVRELQRGGIPTFRAADRALRLLNVFVEERFAHTVRAQMERWVDAFDLMPTTPE